MECTLFETIYARKSDVESLSRLGCKEYVFKPPKRRKGMVYIRAEGAVVVGYC